jgi:hypothetical protein
MARAGFHNIKPVAFFTLVSGHDTEISQIVHQQKICSSKTQFADYGHRAFNIPS